MTSPMTDIPSLLEHLSEHAISALGCGTTTYDTLSQELLAEAGRLGARCPASAVPARAWAASPEMFCLIGLRLFFSYEQVGALLLQYCPPGTASVDVALARLKGIPGMVKHFDRNVAVRTFTRRLNRLSIRPVSEPPQQLSPGCSSLTPPVMSPSLTPLVPPPLMDPPARCLSPCQLSAISQREVNAALSDIKHIVTQSADLHNPLSIVGKSVEVVRRRYNSCKSVCYELVCDKRRPFIADQGTTSTLHGLSTPKLAFGTVTSIVKVRATHDFCGFPDGAELYLMAITIKSTFNEMPKNPNGMRPTSPAPIDLKPLLKRSSVSSPALLAPLPPVPDGKDIPVIPDSWVGEIGKLTLSLSPALQEQIKPFDERQNANCPDGTARTPSPAPIVPVPVAPTTALATQAPDSGEAPHKHRRHLFGFRK